jgi:hypothetical protein
VDQTTGGCAGSRASMVDSARANALHTGNPVYRPGEQYRRDPCPQKGPGPRCRMTTRGSAREQPPMLRAAPERQICRRSRPTSRQRQPALDRRLFARSAWPQMTERDLNPVWPATAESALLRNIKGRKSTSPRSCRRVAVRAVRNPGPRPGRGRRGRARCSDGVPTPRSGGRGGTGEQSARQWGGRESQGPRGPRRAQHP